MQGNICRRVVVRGRVQGVYYRKSAKEKADSLKIKGTVRNLIDGSVELIVSGEERAVNDFVKWCRVGPPLAHVESHTVENLEAGEFNGFLILK